MEGLSSNDSLYKKIIDSSSSGIVAFQAERDEQGNISDFSYLAFNSVSEKIFGQKEEELIGKKVKELFPNGIAARMFPDFVEVVDAGKEIVKEFHSTKKVDKDSTYSSSELWIRISLKKMGDGLVATFDDITTQKITEEALRKSEEKYRVLAEQASDMVSRSTLDGTLLYVSPSCEKILGFTPEEMLQGNAFEKFHPDDIGIVQKGVEELLSTNEISKIIYRSITKAGKYIWLESVGKLIRDQYGNPVEIHGSTRDISDRIYYEEELANRKVELEQEVLKRRETEAQLLKEKEFLENHYQLFHFWSFCVGQKSEYKDVEPRNRANNRYIKRICP